MFMLKVKEDIIEKHLYWLLPICDSAWGAITTLCHVISDVKVKL